MRKAEENQYSFGKVDISQIKINPKSRDEIDKTVKGLQYIYTSDAIRTEVFKLLEEKVLPKVSKKTGRPGMHYWKILVLGVLKQVCSWDYDKLLHFANCDLLIRQLLGHPESEWGEYEYELQTLKDNITLLTPEIIKQISEIVVKAGHNLLGGKKKEELHTNVDSFVVKTDVHHPSDISLLFDSMRKSIKLTADICEVYNIAGWRQSKHNIRTLKNELRRIGQLKHSGKTAQDEKIKTAHSQFISKAGTLLTNVIETLTKIRRDVAVDLVLEIQLQEIEKYIKYAEKHIELIDRRVLRGEIIPHCEKIFSIFESFTRWISKGKMGVPVELGLPLSIMKDQHGFILDYQIMKTETDVDIPVKLTERAIKKFLAIKSISLDKGFWSPTNFKELNEFIAKVVMQKKGYLNKAEKERQSEKEFVKLRRKHSSVESAINGLDHCGLDKCYDHELPGFERCVAMSLLARNIFTLGKHLKEKEEKRLRRKKHKKAA